MCKCPCAFTSNVHSFMTHFSNCTCFVTFYDQLKVRLGQARALTGEWPITYPFSTQTDRYAWSRYAWSRCCLNDLEGSPWLKTILQLIILYRCMASTNHFQKKNPSLEMTIYGYCQKKNRSVNAPMKAYVFLGPTGWRVFLYICVYTKKCLSPSLSL